MRMPLVLLAEASPSLRRALHAALVSRPLDVCEAATARSVIEAAQRHEVDVLLLGRLLDTSGDGVELIARLRRNHITLPAILLAERSSEAQVLAALRAGANDYFAHPLSVPDVIAGVVRCLEAARPAPQDPADGEPLMIGESRTIQDLKDYIRQVAATDSTVLITGETGTGKELAAELIHRMGARRGRPFVSLNCAAIPDHLVESELFGHERGAFTGAEAQREGHLKRADGGTLFLDEVGDMSLAAQAKILRAMDKKPVQRLGGSHSTTLDVRIVAATNHDLERSVDEGTFRRDLYYRLHVARIRIPPLRDRTSDIPELAAHYLGQFNRRYDRSVERIADDALAQLMRHSWPGNVRELRNFLEAVFVTCSSRVIGVADLPEPLGGTPASRLAAERERVVSALFATNWNKSRAAARLSWSRMTLYRKMAKYDLVKSELRPGARRSRLK